MDIFRYLTVCRPARFTFLVSMQSVVIQIIIMLTMSTLIEIPRFFEYNPKSTTFEGHEYHILIHTDLWNSDTYQLVYKCIAMTVIRRIVPLIMTFILTVLLVRFLIQTRMTQVHQLREGLNTSPQRNTTESVTRVLIMIATFYIILHLPGSVYPVMRVTMDIAEVPCEDFYWYFATIADAMSALNSALNFFIFYPGVPAFRAHIKKVVMCGNKNKVNSSNSETFGIPSISTQRTPVSR